MVMFAEDLQINAPQAVMRGIAGSMLLNVRMAREFAACAGA